ncbi:hypothetical protein CLV92_11296 [Kineococcus xinjiangensis]|uniref:Lipoprotein n=1 Tax=Kineococcus xinjiangensis TaxID=512762 RepID=A0A2S6IFJ5_9ACTN|nr:hypothetical protein [Kineococcus xinjiangensis]PPK92920.1 hypothetical protein CLV92_11296 [Kineococcus xinjiangensis]
MTITFRTRHRAGVAAAGVLVASTLGLSACGDTAGPERGTTVEDVQENVAEDIEVGEETEAGLGEGEVSGDIGVDDSNAVVGTYEGAYDPEFYNDIKSFYDKPVTVSAEVSEVISPTAFVIAGTAGTTVDPLLIVSATEVAGVEEGQVVEVTGTVHETFDLPQVEESMGIDLGDDIGEEWGEKPYIAATSVDTEVAPAQ